MSGSLVEHILHARVNFYHGQKNSLCLQHEGKQAWLECRYTPKRSADSCAQNAALIRFPPSVNPPTLMLRKHAHFICKIPQGQNLLPGFGHRLFMNVGQYKIVGLWVCADPH